MTTHNNKCKWLNQQGNPCPWKSLQNKKYCKRHSIYEELYEPEDIPTLIKCSSCKNLFKLEENVTYKTCIKCRSRSKPLKKQIGTKAKVLIEQVKKSTSIGRSQHFNKIEIPQKLNEGSIVDCRIVDVNENVSYAALLV